MEPNRGHPENPEDDDDKDADEHAESDDLERFWFFPCEADALHAYIDNDAEQLLHLLLTSQRAFEFVLRNIAYLCVCMRASHYEHPLMCALLKELEGVKDEQEQYHKYVKKQLRSQQPVLTPDPRLLRLPFPCDAENRDILAYLTPHDTRRRSRRELAYQTTPDEHERPLILSPIEYRQYVEWLEPRAQPCIRRGVQILLDRLSGAARQQYVEVLEMRVASTMASLKNENTV